MSNSLPGVVQFLAALLLRRLGVPLEHDLVLIAVADEEAEGEHGTRFLTSGHPELLSGIAHVLNEGGAIVEVQPDRLLYSVEVTQKAPLWLKLTSRGRPRPVDAQPRVPGGVPRGPAPRRARARHGRDHDAARQRQGERPACGGVGRRRSAPAARPGSRRRHAHRLASDAFAGVHGNDERIEIAAMADGVLALAELIRLFDGESSRHAVDSSRPLREGGPAGLRRGLPSRRRQATGDTGISPRGQEHHAPPLG